jgi:ABC-type branched-subunit amino acid transport system substrate-binding protein
MQPDDPLSASIFAQQRPQGALVGRRFVFLAGASALLTGCAGGGGEVPDAALTSSAQPGAATTLPGASIKVGLLLPFTKSGDRARVANDLKQAAELALFESGKAEIALIPKDTQGTPQGTAAGAKEAIAAGAELLIGPVYAVEAQAVTPVARDANVPVLAFSSDRKVAGNGVYLLSFLAGDEVTREVAYATANGHRNFAALIPQTPYGSVVEQSFRTAVAASGGRLATIERYPVDAAAIADPVNRLKSAIAQAKASGAPIDAILLPGGQDVIPMVAPMLPYDAIGTNQLKLLGTGGWDYPTIGQEASLVGGWFAGPDPAGWKDFSQRYSKTYGRIPLRIASLAYDAVSLAISLSGNAPGQRFTPANLTRTSGFAGIDGLFRLRPDGTCERGLAVLEVQKFGPHVIDPAPSAFSLAQYQPN